jgi:hypothetical protein
MATGFLAKPHDTAEVKPRARRLLAAEMGSKYQGMTFKLGDKKPEASGRKRGTPNRQSLLARAGVRSAIEICRQGGDDPISIMMNAARFLNSVAAAYAPRAQEETDLREIIRATPMKELEFVRRFLMDAATIAHKAAEFGHAKLQRIDWAGDAPAMASVENKMVFVLNVDSTLPGRPCNGRCGNGHDEPSMTKTETDNRDRS